MRDQRRKRGNDFQDWATEWLQQRGWSVHNQKTVSKALLIKGKLIWVSTRNDILGMDLIGVRQGYKTLLVQTTLDSSVEKRIDEIAHIGFDPDHQLVMLWQKKDRYIVNLQRWNGTEYERVGKIVRRELLLADGAGTE